MNTTNKQIHTNFIGQVSLLNMVLLQPWKDLTPLKAYTQSILLPLIMIKITLKYQQHQSLLMTPKCSKECKTEDKIIAHWNMQNKIFKVLILTTLYLKLKALKSHIKLYLHEVILTLGIPDHKLKPITTHVVSLKYLKQFKPIIKNRYRPKRTLSFIAWSG